ncbi:MAG: HEAT repeat domain-containing protein, partial [bacterium]|nr:HEAT repeat domain-containing protein [bacterium]
MKIKGGEMRKYFLIFIFTFLSLLFSQELPKELTLEIENLKSNDPLKRAYGAFRIRNLKYDIKESIPYMLDIIDDETVVFDKNLGKTSPSNESKKTILKFGSLAIPYIYEKLSQSEITKTKKLKFIELIDEIKDEKGIKFLEKFVNDPDTEIKEKVIEILSKYESEVDFLISFIKSQDDYVKIKVINFWGKNKINQSLPFLYAFLKDNNWEIRKYAIWAIGEIRENVDIKNLIPLIKDKNELVRKELAETFGKIKNPFVIPYLIELFDDTNWLVRISAIKAAVEINDTRFFEPILNMIYDKQIEVKLEAIKALSIFKDKRATIPLISNLNDRYHL